MKTYLFIGLIAGSAVYLLSSESSVLTKWLNMPSPQSQMEKITLSLNQKVEQQISDFKQQVEAGQQAQFVLLQQKLTSMEDKMAQMQTQQTAVKADVKLAVETAATAATTLEAKAPITVQAPSNVEVYSLASAPQTAAEVRQAVKPVVVAATTTTSTTAETPAAEPLMNMQQRRKALQNLSQRMALKALSMGR